MSGIIKLCSAAVFSRQNNHTRKRQMPKISLLFTFHISHLNACAFAILDQDRMVVVRMFDMRSRIIALLSLEYGVLYSIGRENTARRLEITYGNGNMFGDWNKTIGT